MTINSPHSFPHNGVFITDGLSIADAKKRYSQRRSQLLSRLQHPLLLIGPAFGPSGNYPWAHIHRTIYQDPYLLYLTGINQPCTGLWLDPSNNEITLFLQKKDPKLEFWEGTRFGSGNDVGTREVRDIVGIKSVVDHGEIVHYVKSHLNNRQLGVIWNTQNGRPKKDQTWADITSYIKSIKRQVPGVIVNNLVDLMWQQRLIMDETDISNIKIANAKTSDAYVALLKTLKHLPTEHAACAVLEYEINLQSSFGVSFPSIVAGGKNAAVLHYTKNNEPLAPESLLLTDFGVRWHAMHSDVTRTAPVSGKYSPLQRLLIDIVLGAQDLVQSLAAPGISIKELNDQCWAYINAELEKKITRKAGNIHLPYTTGPHNVSHFLGHQVHDGDPSREYRSRPLEPGNIISNEPGIYGEFSLIMNGIRYHETLGIRIEDDLLITQSGCINLTTCIKDPHAIEKIVSGQ